MQSYNIKKKGGGVKNCRATITFNLGIQHKADAESLLLQYPVSQFLHPFIQDLKWVSQTPASFKKKNPQTGGDLISKCMT